jgi:hypothetical protein
MGLFFGADVMKVCLFTGGMLDDDLLAKVLMETRSGQFLLRLRFLLDLVCRVFEIVKAFRESLVHIHPFIDKFNKTIPI